MAPTSLAELSREQLAVLVPELLLAGHLIDRAGMPQLIAEFGLDVMRDVAIDEWMAASPIYARRMQRALGYEGDSVETIFKGMQLDIGAPPQFMDFRYKLDGHDYGEFWLDHCGALMDVEPMGEEFVMAMCHDIEDPTFDGTAITTNPRARVRPLHRPPRTPADRHPHCHWTVTISEEHDPLPTPAVAESMLATRAAQLELHAIDRAEPGRADYRGPLLSDLPFADFSRSALVRIAEEVCLQGHLLALGFFAAVRARTESDDQATNIFRKQFTGIAGLTAERLRLALGFGADLEGVAGVLALHPAFQPRAYVKVDIDLSDRLVIRLDPACGAMVDGAWLTLIDAEHLEPLDALVRGVDPHLRCEALEAADGGELIVEVVRGEEPAPEAEEVALARFSTGADFTFEDRGTPVALGPTRR
jgi:hypothetical protein